VHSNRRLLSIAVIGGLVAIGVVIVLHDGRTPATTESSMSFDGSSESLHGTVVVPTLDAPIPQHKSAIWCSSFQLAWNHLKTDLAKGPVRLANAQSSADRLNEAAESESDLVAKDHYAAAGFVKDGILTKIRAEMAEKFPNVAPGLANDLPATGAVAYGYLKAQVKFTTPFFENDEALRFNDSTGGKIDVQSFGIRKKDDYAYNQLRHQVRVLYRDKNYERMEKGEGDFIIDPCKYSDPYQVIVAVIERKPTLAEAIAEVDKKVPANPGDTFDSVIHPRDSVLIPSMHWRISHSFKELEGPDKKSLNPSLEGAYIDKAMQVTEFRIDRNGVELSSESKVYVKPDDVHYQCDRPFLLLLKKRQGGRPFFVMWVDNAELLHKWR
jgi:hypothetical protein